MVDKDIIIARLLEQNQLLTEQVQLLEAKVQLLMEENQKLRERIARLEKNSSNSSKPPSSDIINPQPQNNKKKKRKIGGQMGHPKYSRGIFKANEISKTIVHKMSAKEVHHRGLIPLDKTESVLQQIDLPEQLFNVIEHRVQLYLDPNGEIVKAKLPKDVRRVGLFSVRMTAFTGYRR